jgi:hypothetical protein
MAPPHRRQWYERPRTASGRGTGQQPVNDLGIYGGISRRNANAGNELEGQLTLRVLTGITYYEAQNENKGR